MMVASFNRTIMSKGNTESLRLSRPNAVEATLPHSLGDLHLALRCTLTRNTDFWRIPGDE